MQQYSIPISVKGIVFEDGAVWLRKNEREEWELPGGKIDAGEQPEQTVARELKEELGFTVSVLKIVQVYIYTIRKSPNEVREVLVLSYLCIIKSKTGIFELEGEAGKSEFKKFPLLEIPGLSMPQFYKDAIMSCKD